jgi:hypothetical protein
VKKNDHKIAIFVCSTYIRQIVSFVTNEEALLSSLLSLLPEERVERAVVQRGEEPLL